MKRKLILTGVLTALSISGASLAMAESGDNASLTELQMFQSAKVSLDKAAQIALKEVPGALSSIGFNDENGQGVYQAMIVGADGQLSIVKIDADTGAVLGKGLASNFDDEEDGAEHADRVDHADGEGVERDEG